MFVVQASLVPQSEAAVEVMLKSGSSPLDPLSLLLAEPFKALPDLLLPGEIPQGSLLGPHQFFPPSSSFLSTQSERKDLGIVSGPILMMWL